ncbi:hypothetical protein An18g02260 [Aspergillus niger]|uniref:Uncharacterized protein n=2 Tax=Aspergillus niger TaxID=5061 RepID=A2RA83_ASPNC|nr:hypothetical protein An18g02260 [Aspergillus niger]CAK47298.1 hypothetical protein An18g02260 [Aspergillus niger]
MGYGGPAASSAALSPKGVIIGQVLTVVARAFCGARRSIRKFALPRLLSGRSANTAMQLEGGGASGEEEGKGKQRNPHFRETQTAHPSRGPIKAYLREWGPDPPGLTRDHFP